MKLQGIFPAITTPFDHNDCTIFSSANLLRITSVAPFACINCFFLNSENSRLTVSRVVPMISAHSGQNLCAHHQPEFYERHFT